MIFFHVYFMFYVTINTFSLQAHLALYCFANSQVTVALKLLYRARYLLVVVCGEIHPEMAVLDVSIMSLMILSNVTFLPT